MLKDLIATRLAAGQDLRFAHTALEVRGADTRQPSIRVAGPEGDEFEIVADVVVGADGSRSLARAP